MPCLNACCFGTWLVSKLRWCINTFKYADGLSKTSKCSPRFQLQWWFVHALFEGFVVNVVDLMHYNRWIRGRCGPFFHLLLYIIVCFCALQTYQMIADRLTDIWTDTHSLTDPLSISHRRNLQSAAVSLADDVHCNALSIHWERCCALAYRR